MAMTEIYDIPADIKTFFAEIQGNEMNTEDIATKMELLHKKYNIIITPNMLKNASVFMAGILKSLRKSKKQNDGSKNDIHTSMQIVDGNGELVEINPNNVQSINQNFLNNDNLQSNLKKIRQCVSIGRSKSEPRTKSVSINKTKQVQGTQSATMPLNESPLNVTSSKVKKQETKNQQKNQTVSNVSNQTKNVKKTVPISYLDFLKKDEINETAIRLAKKEMEQALFSKKKGAQFVETSKSKDIIANEETSEDVKVSTIPTNEEVKTIKEIPEAIKEDREMAEEFSNTIKSIPQNEETPTIKENIILGGVVEVHESTKDEVASADLPGLLQRKKFASAHEKTPEVKLQLNSAPKIQNNFIEPKPVFESQLTSEQIAASKAREEEIRKLLSTDEILKYRDDDWDDILQVKQNELKQKGEEIKVTHEMIHNDISKQLKNLLKTAIAHNVKAPATKQEYYAANKMWHRLDEMGVYYGYGSDLSGKDKEYAEFTYYAIQGMKDICQRINGTQSEICAIDWIKNNKEEQEELAKLRDEYTEKVVQLLPIDNEKKKLSFAVINAMFGNHMNYLMERNNFISTKAVCETMKKSFDVVDKIQNLDFDKLDQEKLKRFSIDAVGAVANSHFYGCKNDDEIRKNVFRQQEIDQYFEILTGEKTVDAVEGQHVANLKNQQNHTAGGKAI